MPFNFDFSTFNFNLESNTTKVVAIVGLLFILLLVLAKMRRHYVDWSLKGAVFGVFFGFLLALILEGFLIIGGKTAVTEILGWKNAPKPLLVMIDSGKNELIKVLGIDSQIPDSFAQDNPTTDAAIEVLQSLDPTEIKKVKSIICEE